MVKKMKENKKENSDNIAAIGIGAMIVFIALILVAAVAAAVIIQTAEKLQQNAQTTGEETTSLLSSKVVIKNVIIPSAGALYLTFELAPGSDPINPANVDWAIVCAGGADYGNFATATVVGAQAAVNPLSPGSTYDVVLTAAPAGDLTQCAPTANQDHTLAIQSGAGGFTYEVLNYGADVSAGAKVI
jgi:flagellin FlaB|tara:strand:+ start:504 stop:1064 length:561 start_codon:yes stop_codon:yes gene_type:complete